MTIATALCVPAHSRAADRSDPFTENWAKMPSQADRAEALARFRIGPLVTGRAAVRCAVEDSGVLSQCRIAFESPVGGAFGAAALSLVPRYQRKPPGKDDLRMVNILFDQYPIDKGPDWARKPRAEDILAVWPSAAMKRGISGAALISCIVTVQGALTECITIEETPAGEGFGGAAIALTPQFTMRPASLNGAPAPIIIRVPIRFQTNGRVADVTAAKKVAPANLAWAEAPSYAEVVAAYPRKAAAERIGGRATIGCEMTREGRLAFCSTIRSEPIGYGFDTAAKALARQFRLQLETPEDIKAARSVVVHLPFTFDQSMLSQAPPVVGKPSWSRIPQLADMQAEFEKLKVPGTIRVMLECTVQPGGGLGGCKVDGESPAGSGVGAAGLALAPRFKVSTWTAEGLPTVGATIRVPLRYETAQSTPATPSSPQ